MFATWRRLHFTLKKKFEIRNFQILRDLVENLRQKILETTSGILRADKRTIRLFFFILLLLARPSRDFFISWKLEWLAKKNNQKAGKSLCSEQQKWIPSYFFARKLDLKMKLASHLRHTFKALKLFPEITLKEVKTVKLLLQVFHFRKSDKPWEMCYNFCHFF
jgi:hypothetical protein